VEGLTPALHAPTTEQRRKQMALEDELSKRMQELEELVGTINMVVISPRSDKGKLAIIKALLRADITKER
jgi:hypothetical protein